MKRVSRIEEAGERGERGDSVSTGLVIRERRLKGRTDEKEKEPGKSREPLKQICTLSRRSEGVVISLRYFLWHVGTGKLINK